MQPKKRLLWPMPFPELVANEALAGSDVFGPALELLEWVRGLAKDRPLYVRTTRIWRRRGLVKITGFAPGEDRGRPPASWSSG